MTDLLDDIYKSPEGFFWTMYQKIDSSLSVEKIVERVNKINTKHFKVIDNQFQTLADPFLFKYENDMYVFFEKINLQRWNPRLNDGTGEIYCCKLSNIDGKLTYSKPTLVLSTEFHLSYPMLLKDGENIYMLPEQKLSGGLQLYKCVSFPNEWKHVKTLIIGRFVDSNIFYYNNMYWLFAISTDKKNSRFKEELYYAPTLVTRHWNHHSTINVTEKIHSRRGAGNIFMKDGKIYRPVQHNKDYYGQGVLILEITKLSTTEYEEKPVGIINRDVHTINMLDDWIVIDSNTRGKKFFEPDYERSISRWTKKNRKIMIDKYYKEIGDWLRTRDTKNVLDIGINMFNIYNKSYFNNESINYYQIDIAVPNEIKEKLESKVLIDNFIGLDKKSPEYINYFDVIISYGVLGYIEFTQKEISEYLKTVSKLLKKDGKFYLKLDKKHMNEKFKKENIVTEKHILTCFKSVNVLGNKAKTLEPQTVIDDDYILIILKKDGKLYLKLDKSDMNEKNKKENMTLFNPINMLEKVINSQESSETLEIDSIIDDDYIFYVLNKL